MVSKRTAIPEKVKRAVLTESGYMCAVPTCRCLLIEIHHIVPVKLDGKNEASNLLPLCPNHHALFEIGKIKQESIEAWKTMLVVLNNALVKESISNLLLLNKLPDLVITGDGVLKFSNIIAGDLACANQSGELYFGLPPLYKVSLTDKGNRIIEAWLSGSRDQVRQALNDITLYNSE